jgi:hypothetical protein
MREGVNDFRDELREQGDEMTEFMSLMAGLSKITSSGSVLLSARYSKTT